MHLQPLHLPYDDPDLQSFYIQIFNHTYGEKQISEQNTFFIKEISLVIKKGKKIQFRSLILIAFQSQSGSKFTTM